MLVGPFAADDGAHEDGQLGRDSRAPDHCEYQMILGYASLQLYSS